MARFDFTSHLKRKGIVSPTQACTHIPSCQVSRAITSCWGHILVTASFVSQRDQPPRRGSFGLPTEAALANTKRKGSQQPTLSWETSSACPSLLPVSHCLVIGLEENCLISSSISPTALMGGKGAIKPSPEWQDGCSSLPPRKPQPRGRNSLWLG